MEERLGLVMEVLEGRFTVAEASARHGVSRKTAYKYLDRYREEGVAGLEERSRKPHGSPNATPDEIRRLLVEEKKQHPSWGPKKIVDRLGKRYRNLTMPATSTAGAILKAAGLVQSRRRTRTVFPAPAWTRERTPADAPNRVWTIDFKGEFRLGNGTLCYPLTVVDLYSRDPRVIHALRSTQGAPVQDVLTRLFERDGLPEVLRSDCGSPFASRALGKLSRLSVWWLKLGIRLERNDPGHPEQNGAHERMHRTLKAETTRPPQFDFAQQQRVFDAFREEYSQQRPHEGIGMRCPAELYVTSARTLPAALPVVRYPGHYEIRSVRPDGYIKWTGRTLFVSEALAGERVGLEEVDDGLWSLYFGSTLLGRFDAQCAGLHSQRARAGHR
jgi:transposase InsO family protein